MQRLSESSQVASAKVTHKINDDLFSALCDVSSFFVSSIFFYLRALRIVPLNKRHTINDDFLSALCYESLLFVSSIYFYLLQRLSESSQGGLSKGVVDFPGTKIYKLNLN